MLPNTPKENQWYIPKAMDEIMMPLRKPILLMRM
jgi:hypothetical protein